MIGLFEIYNRLLDEVNHDFVRYLMPELENRRRLTGVMGARGTGKTTLLLQFATTLPQGGKTLYVSLEEFYFNSNSLVDLADEFVKKGGIYLLLDEVHRYAGWSKEIKLIYDRYTNLKIVFTGSSLIELGKGMADLSRRAVIFHLKGLSFREYLQWHSGQAFEVLELDDLVHHHVAHAKSILKKVKPFEYFESYLKNGYYPFRKENPADYDIKLRQVINMSLGIDLAAAYDIPFSSIQKVGQLLSVIADSVPFKPDVTALSGLIAIDRNTFIKYLGYLEDIDLIKRLYSTAEGMGRMRKPSKIYLENPNLMWAIGNQNPEKGNLRETFFFNQISGTGYVAYPQSGDFHIRGYTFEIGGKSKKKKQIDGIENAFVVKDDIEVGIQDTIPLWLFGFLY